MYEPVDRNYQLENLKDIMPCIQDLNFFIFFGTLLGFYRENNIIQTDDDIDFYLDINDKRVCMENILKNTSFNISIDEKYFFQLTRKINDVMTYVDFYLYEKDDERKITIDRWNFFGDPDNPDLHMHIPNAILYPTKLTSFNNIMVKVPFDVKKCCQFLYGKHFMKPLRKTIDYRMNFNNNKPQITLRRPLRRTLRTYIKKYLFFYSK